MALLYTICFCRNSEMVLMLYRNRPPNQFHWNGLGGKLKENETPQACVQREVLEEANIDLHVAHRLRFTGIVTWDFDSTSASSGMYAFVADFQQTSVTWEGDHEVPEGLLCWKPLQWVCDLNNTAVVSNIPHFCPTCFLKIFRWSITVSTTIGILLGWLCVHCHRLSILLIKGFD